MVAAPHVQRPLSHGGQQKSPMGRDAERLSAHAKPTGVSSKAGVMRSAGEVRNRISDADAWGRTELVRNGLNGQPPVVATATVPDSFSFVKDAMDNLIK